VKFENRREIVGEVNGMKSECVVSLTRSRKEDGGVQWWCCSRRSVVAINVVDTYGYEREGGDLQVAGGGRDIPSNRLIQFLSRRGLPLHNSIGQ